MFKVCLAHINAAAKILRKNNERSSNKQSCLFPSSSKSSLKLIKENKVKNNSCERKIRKNWKIGLLDVII